MDISNDSVRHNPCFGYVLCYSFLSLFYYRLLVHQGIYRSRDLPYTSQLIPLAAIYAYDNENSKLLILGTNQNLLAQWYWCRVMGELYGGANEARFARIQ